MEQVVSSDFKLGVITGGQLGKMLILAASNWDVKTYVMDMEKDCPASSCCTGVILGSPLNYQDVYDFGQQVDMITFEIENINIQALRDLQAQGKRVYPDPSSLEIIQDKGLQKQFFADNNIPSSSFSLVKDSDEIRKNIDVGKLELPFVQKLRKGGYDGRGVALIQNDADLNDMLEGPCVVEDKVNISKEISVIVARNVSGDVSCFPTVEMDFREGAFIVERLMCPTNVPEEIEQTAQKIAIQIAEGMNFVGVLAVEMFIDPENNVCVNEMAPRPHNSGHHTIESTYTSQYEQLLRAIFNFPLGSTKIKTPSVMINLLGEEGETGPVKYEGLEESLKIEGVKVHLYGKKITKPMRKMGHVTILSSDLQDAKEKSEIVKNTLKVKSWKK